MTSLDPTGLPPPQRLAVAYSPRAVRPAMLSLLGLDTRLGRTLRSAREPMLVQMRLAWWREELAKPAGKRAASDPVLGALEEPWQGHEAALRALVDGWENLLGDSPISRLSIEAFADGRGAAFAGLAEVVGAAPAAEPARRAARRWALSDFVFRVSDPVERDRGRALYDGLEPRIERLPRDLRGLAVLDGLARRAMRRDEPLMTGRGAALAAMRLGMLGR